MDINPLIKILFLRKHIRTSQNYNDRRCFAKFGIGVLKYELLANLKFLSQISTVYKNSKYKVTWNVSQQNFSKNQLQSQKTDYTYTSVEQLSCQILILSGGQQDNKNRFTICDGNENTQELQMLCERYLHRTCFDKKELDYIISGRNNQNYNEQDVTKCEVFNLKTKQFNNIAEIPTPACGFGCGQDEQTLFTFGGYNWAQRNPLNVIQAYDKNQDQWHLCQEKLPENDTTSAI